MPYYSNKIVGFSTFVFKGVEALSARRQQLGDMKIGS
jgi:hypothetical protein